MAKKKDIEYVGKRAYKCRLCGDVFTEDFDETSSNFITELFNSNSTEKELGRVSEGMKRMGYDYNESCKAKLFFYHRCADGCLGVGDLIGLTQIGKAVVKKRHYKSGHMTIEYNRLED